LRVIGSEALGTGRGTQFHLGREERAARARDTGSDPSRGDDPIEPSRLFIATPS
jgi:hypothetical protein